MRETIELGRALAGGCTIRLESAPLVAMTPSIGRKSLRALIAVYSQLLDKIVDSGYEVLGPRVRLPLWRKLWILVSNAI